MSQSEHYDLQGPVAPNDRENSMKENDENLENAVPFTLDLCLIGLMFERRDNAIFSSLQQLRDALVSIPIVPDEGLSAERVCDSRLKYGSNSVPSLIKSSYQEQVKRTLSSKNFSQILVMTFICLVIRMIHRFSFNLSYWKQEPIVSLILTFPIVVLLGLSESKLAKKIETIQIELNEKSSEDKTLVLRSGSITSVPSSELVVGDIFIVKSGSMIPADGICIECSNFSCDEGFIAAGATKVRKDALDDGPNYLVMSGSVVLSGVAKILCLGIGSNSLIGKKKLLSSSKQNEELTPLKVGIKRVDKLLNDISKIMIAVYMLLRVYGLQKQLQELQGSMKSLLITILWYLPSLALEVFIISMLLFSTILSKIASLSFIFSAMNMSKSGLLVKLSSKLEMLGRTTAVVTRDIGFLTVNHMYVTSATVAGSEMNLNFTMPPGLNYQSSARASCHDPTKFFISTVTNESIVKFCRALILSTIYQKDTINDSPLFSTKEGDKIHFPSDEYSESWTATAKWPESLISDALSGFVKWLGYDSEVIESTHKILKIIPYNRDNKFAAVIVESEHSGVELFVVGMGERLIPMITHYVTHSKTSTNSDEVNVLNPYYRKKLNSDLSNYTRRAMLTIMVAYRKLSGYDKTSDILSEYDDANKIMDNDLVHIGTVGISNPLYPGMAGAISAMKKSKVNLILLTRDEPGVSNSILWKCGGMDGEGEVSIDGKRLVSTPCQDFDEIIKHVKVVYDCGPHKAHILVEKLIHSGRIVTFTYTGLDSSDEVAARASNVLCTIGLATPAAKLVSDIILVNNSLVNLVKCIMYGRALIFNARRYVLYKVSANLTMFLSLFYVKVISNDELQFNYVRLLIIILLIDHYNAYAITSGGPVKGLLQREPESVEQPFITLRSFTLQLIFTTIEWCYMLAVCHKIAVNSQDNTITDREINEIKQSLILCYVMLMIVLGHIHWTRPSLENSIKLNLYLVLKNRRVLLYSILIIVVQYIILTSSFISSLIKVKAISPRQWFLVFILCISTILIGISSNRVYHLASLVWKKKSLSSRNDYEVLNEEDTQLETENEANGVNKNETHVDINSESVQNRG